MAGDYWIELSLPTKKYGWLFASKKKREMHSIFSSRVCIANSHFSGFHTHFVLPTFLRYASELAYASPYNPCHGLKGDRPCFIFIDDSISSVTNCPSFCLFNHQSTIKAKIKILLKLAARISGCFTITLFS